jgi:hypothetical protein
MNRRWISTRQSRSRVLANTPRRSWQARGRGRTDSVAGTGRDTIGLGLRGSARHVSRISHLGDCLARWEMPGPPSGGRNSFL